MERAVGLRRRASGIAAAIATVASTCAVMAVAPLLVQDLPTAGAAPVGVPHPPVTLFVEDFEANGTASPVVRVNTYPNVAVDTKYTADGSWLTSCNGLVARGSHLTNDATGVSGCSNNTGSWNAAQRLAVALGMYRGQTGTAALANHAVSAYTSADGVSTDQSMFRTVTPIPLAVLNRFVSVSVDVGVISCWATYKPNLTFAMTPVGASAIEVGSNINPCGLPLLGAVPAVGLSTTRSTEYRAGTITAPSAQKVTTTGFHLSVHNTESHGAGNDFAFDNVAISDVTPRLDQQFLTTSGGVGEPVTLRYTVTNTTELGSKAGWSFTPLLPAHLAILGTPTSTCPNYSGAMVGSALNLSGDLAVGMASCTVDVVVVPSGTGTFVLNNGSAVDLDGLNPPQTTQLTVTSQPSLAVVKSTSTPSISSVGQTVLYSMRVTNTGNVALTTVVLSDPIADSVSCPSTALSVGASMLCTGSRSVTQVDADRGHIENRASVTALDPLGATVGPTASNVVLTSAIQLPALSVLKRPTGSIVGEVGSSLGYEFVVTNTGNVTLDTMSVSDPLVPTITCPTTTLVPGGSTVCHGDHVVTQSEADAGVITNQATATARGPGGTSITPIVSNTVRVTVPQRREIAVTLATTVSSFDAASTPIPFTYTVTNTGNVTVSGVQLTDSLGLTVTCPGTQLLAGESMTCTASYSTTAADLTNGGVVNTATAGGLGPGAVPISSVSNTVDVDGEQRPGLTIVKSTSVTVVASAGDTVSYDLLVVNTGNVSLAGVGVSDPLIGSVSCPTTALAAAESMTCTGTHRITQSEFESGYLDNTASVSALAPNSVVIGPVTSNTVRVPAQHIPATTVTKMPRTTSIGSVGDPLPFLFVVHNTGNVTLDNVALSDPQLGTVTCGATLLAPGASTSCDGSRPVNQTDLDLGEVVNTASLTAIAPDMTTHEAQSNTVRLTASQVASLSLVKSTTLGAVTSPGQEVPYRIVVTNTGNVTLFDIEVVDPLVPGWRCERTSLGPGVEHECLASYRVTQADIETGVITNTARVTGTDPASASVSAASNTLVTRVAQVASSTILKRSDVGTFREVGAPVGFTFEVVNAGNVRLESVAVHDPLIKEIVCPETTLAVGQRMTCRGTYYSTTADVVAGKVVNVASVTAVGAGGAVRADVMSNQVNVMHSNGESSAPIDQNGPWSAPERTIDPMSRMLAHTGATVRWYGALALVGAGVIVMIIRRRIEPNTASAE